ncbi:MAG: cytochrome P450 [Acidimicrobiales bacterium]|nr:cytochrome P450 [Acidimicrobiales bacterium]
MDLASIDLSDTRFWDRPLVERAAAFDLLRAEDPYRYFALPAEITEQFPQRGYHALVRHADVAEASRRPDDFCSGQGGTSAVDLPSSELTRYFGSMISMDDPRHRRLRSIVSAGFTPGRIRALEDSVQRIAGEVVVDLLERGPCDFVTEVASRLPLQIICEMMGVPEEQWSLVFEQSNTILGGQDDEYRSDDVDLGAQLFLAAYQLTELMQGLIAERVEQPTDDLTSALVHAEVDGERLEHDEIASFFILLLVAGNETTRNAISWGLHLLTEHEDQRAAWWDDFEGVAPTAVEEVVRWASPVISMRRTATRDGVRLGEREFAEGDKVVLYYWAANRDPGVFEEPLVFDVRRTPNDHFGFGAPGPHFCLGAHLARREVTVMWRELFERVPGIHATSAPDRLTSGFINGVKHLPCAW